jgi:hypothetical protein
MELKNTEENVLSRNPGRDDFAAHDGSSFKFYRGDLEFEAKLVEVTELKKYPRHECFGLTFLLPEDFGRLQGNYCVEHPVLGAGEIFIVPLEATEEGILFHAVFNRLLPRS